MARCLGSCAMDSLIYGWLSGKIDGQRDGIAGEKVVWIGARIMGSQIDGWLDGRMDR